MQYLSILLGIYLGLKLAVRLQITFRIRGLQFHPQALRIISREELLAHEAAVLSSPEAELLASGFRYSHTECSRRTESGVLCETRHLIFIHDARRLAVSVSPSSAPDSTRTVNRTVVSRLNDGRMIYTADVAGSFLLGDTPHLKMLYCYDPALEALLAAHERAISELVPASSGGTEFKSPEDFLHAENSSGDLWLESLERRGILIRSDCGLFFPTFAAAFRVAGPLLKELQRSAAERRRAGAPARDLPIEAEVAAYRQLARVHEKASMERAAKVILFVLTGALFCVSFGQLLSFRSVLILGGVIVFHELGHLIGMRFFGFRDLKLLFLPFLGAVAIGKRRNITPFQRVVVALLGPVPGLLLGLACYGATQHFGLQDRDWLVELTWTLIGLNFFNLLPIMPLDGGQVLHALIFSRRPALEAFFTIAGAVALGAMALAWEQPILAFVALLILVSTKEQVRKARLLLSLRRRVHRAEQPPLEDEALVTEIFSHLSEQGLKSLPFQRKFQIADYLASNVRIPTAGFAQTTALIALYLVSLCLLPGFFAARYLSEDRPTVHSQPADSRAFHPDESEYAPSDEPLPEGSIRI
ncbi:MAG: site-2 protease family protein [Bdellovibrionota bacterium]